MLGTVSASSVAVLDSWLTPHDHLASVCPSLLSYLEPDLPRMTQSLQCNQCLCQTLPISESHPMMKQDVANIIHQRNLKILVYCTYIVKLILSVLCGLRKLFNHATNLVWDNRLKSFLTITIIDKQGAKYSAIFRRVNILRAFQSA